MVSVYSILPKAWVSTQCGLWLIDWLNSGQGICVQWICTDPHRISHPIPIPRPTLWGATMSGAWHSPLHGNHLQSRCVVPWWWNERPSCLQSAQSLPIFKKHQKTHLSQEHLTSCWLGNLWLCYTSSLEHNSGCMYCSRIIMIILLLLLLLLVFIIIIIIIHFNQGFSHFSRYSKTLSQQIKSHNKNIKLGQVSMSDPVIRHSAAME